LEFIICLGFRVWNLEFYLDNMRTINDAGDLAGKKVLVRSDFNVTIENGKILDDFKIRASLATIKYLLERKAKIILISHLGRPRGNVVEELRLDPIAKRLSDLLGLSIKKINESVGKEVENEAGKMQEGEIILLENIQFNPGEAENDPDFAKILSSYADIFILDAFGQSHRDYASISGIEKFLPSYAGLLLQKEVEILSRVKDNPERPLTVIIGGAKISTKIKLIREYLRRADHVILGGALANTVLHAQGLAIGKSFIEEEALPEVELLKITDTKLHLPVDVIASSDKSGNSECRVSAVGNISGEELILDIGPETENMFDSVIKTSKTILWNGPMGLFEIEKFSYGTRAIAESIAGCPDCFSVAGGGETTCFIENLGLIDKFSHVSTGGGAMLEFLAGDKLPGIEALN